MGFLSFKKSFITSGLLYGMTDIHCHILPDVDDGIKKYDEAVKSLRWLKSKGIEHLYLTPHVMSDFSKNTSVYLTEMFHAFVKRMEEEGIGDIPELKLGGEYMLESAFEKHKEEGLLTYANRYVLVETSYMMPPVGFMRLLEELMENGYSPVLAHPERYIYMDMKDYELLKRHGVRFQLNFLSMTGVYGRSAKEKAVHLLKDNRYDYAGSDFHRLARHEKAFTDKILTKKQIAAIRILFDHNKKLW